MLAKNVLGIGLLVGCLVAVGCGESGTDHDAEARQQINADNMDQQLQSLEKEIEAPGPE